MIPQKHQIRDFILKRIRAHPEDIVAVAAKRFDLTRPAIHRHLNNLLQRGLVIKTGHKRSTRYILPTNNRLGFTIHLTQGVQEDHVWKEKVAPLLAAFKSNIQEVFYYGFTEMLNNVIDHSEATHVTVRLKPTGDKLTLEISDNGVGVFNKIREHFHLEDQRESILMLCKGKVTTAPEQHSGEGFFFTSRLFDEFSLASGGLRYVRANAADTDWFIESRPVKSQQGIKERGTCVTLTLSKNTTRRMRDIFDAYADPDTFRFDRTEVFVKLAQLEEERYISRSQAKRLLVGLEQFKRVTLDFKKVVSVGQAFVDEVFRVFQNAHPDIRIECVNTNVDVDFMIKRGLQ